MTDLFAQLATLTGMAEPVLWAGVLVFLRIGAAMALLPAFGEQVVPQRVRLAVALAFTLIVTPMVADDVRGLRGLAPAAAEVAAGLMLGAALRLLVVTLQTTGMIVAQSTSLSQLFPDMAGEQQPALTGLMVMGALALATASGLHVAVADMLARSYAILPAGGIPASSDVLTWGLGRVRMAFELAFALAMPFVIAGFLYNLALGAINRAMPALMVSFIGAPALAGGGLVLSLIVTPPVLVLWQDSLRSVLAAPMGIWP